MQVKLAESAGFCFGVNRAMDTVYKQIEQNPEVPIYTYGPIIHNDTVVKDLLERGVRAVSDDEIDTIPKGVMIIRSHGVSKAVQDRIESAGFTVVDATCPFVKKIHRIVQKESNEGKRIIIVGSRLHPEVEGIVGWCASTPLVIENTDEIDNLLSDFKDDEICIVSQTTFNYKKFQEIVDYIAKRGYYINVVNTICNATEERQHEAGELAREADCMIVIGDSHSSNSRKLYEICKVECENTHFIQTLDDLNLEIPKSVRLVGITAGASTPNNIIEEVQNYVRNEF